jgi:hypothetical protein
MTASDPIFKPVTLPDFQNGNDTRQKSEHQCQLRRLTLAQTFQSWSHRNRRPEFHSVYGSGNSNCPDLILWTTSAWNASAASLVPKCRA